MHPLTFVICLQFIVACDAVHVSIEIQHVGKRLLPAARRIGANGWTYGPGPPTLLWLTFPSLCSPYRSFCDSSRREVRTLGIVQHVCLGRTPLRLYCPCICLNVPCMRPFMAPQILSPSCPLCTHTVATIAVVSFRPMPSHAQRCWLFMNDVS